MPHPSKQLRHTIERQTDRQTDNRQKGTQTDRQTDRQTNNKPTKPTTWYLPSRENSKTSVTFLYMHQNGTQKSK